MGKIFVFGATGFAGLPICRALRAQGHHVWGLTRSKLKANALVKEEITAVIGDVSDAESWRPVIEKVIINVVIDCSAVNQGASDILRTCAAISKKRIETYGHGGKAAKMGYIYVSGIWVLGTLKNLQPVYIDEMWPVGDNAPQRPAELVAWRVEIENQVLQQSHVLNAIVIRPGTMFGGSGSSIGEAWWGPICEAVSKGEKEVELPGRPDAILSLVHKDDVGRILVKAVEKIEFLSTISYPIFSATSCHENLGLISESAAKHLSLDAKSSIVPKVTYREPSTAFEEAMCCSGYFDSDRTKDLLGWTPRHTSLLKDMETYVRSFAGHFKV